MTNLSPTIESHGTERGIVSYGWHGFDFLGFAVTGSIADRRSPHWPMWDCWVNRGELIVYFGRLEVIVTPPWWKPRSSERRSA